MSNKKRTRNSLLLGLLTLFAFIGIGLAANASLA